MRGSIWSVVVLGCSLALLPMILDFEGDPDTEGQLTADLFGIVQVFDGVLGLLLFVAAMAALVAFFVTDDF